jgi:hypothetical protein
MFNYIANANNFFIYDLKIDMVQIRGGLTSFKSVGKHGHLVFMHIMMICRLYICRISIVQIIFGAKR